MPDKDGTPDCPIKSFTARIGDTTPFAHDERGTSGRAVEGEKHDGNTRGSRVDTGECTAELLRWKPEQLKELLINLGLNVADCTKKHDVVERIVNHPRGLAAAAVTAAARDDFFPSFPGERKSRNNYKVQGARAVEEPAEYQCVGVESAGVMQWTTRKWLLE